jgi:ribosome-binding factor A
MVHRLERLASLIRQVVMEAIMRRISDPRVSPFTSVTRVEVAPDLSFADVHVSVMGSDSDQRTTLRGLQSARGMVQSMLARDLSTRHCPTLRFHLDDSIKRGIATIKKIEEIVPPASTEDAGATEGDDSGGPAA